MNTSILILPGYGNSDDKHWQSIWQKQNPNFTRVNQTSWHKPDCAEWVNALEKAVAKAGPDVKLVAHSLGCLLLASWAAQTKLKIAGALLVAAPNPKGENFPQLATGFSPVATEKFNFPSTIIASSNDPYSDMTFARNCANSWGSKLIELGDYGHINSESGLDDWPFGFEQLQKTHIT